MLYDDMMSLFLLSFVKKAKIFMKFLSKKFKYIVSETSRVTVPERLILDTLPR